MSLKGEREGDRRALCVQGGQERKGDRRAEQARAVIMAKAAAKAHYPRQKTSYGRQSWFQSVLLTEREGRRK